MACGETAVAGFLTVSREMTESIRRVIDKPSLKLARAVKAESRGRTDDRILVLSMWRLYLMSPKIPTKVEQTFNFLEIRAMNLQPEHRVVIETEKSTCSLRLQSSDHLGQLLGHVNVALSRIFNNSIYAPSFFQTDGDVSDAGHKFSPNSETSVETQRTCGGFSETYAALCDYNGISCKEEIQWDVDTIYHAQDNRELNLLDFGHLESRDLAVIVAAMAYNTWFTKLSCKDLRLSSEVVEQVLHTVSKSSNLEELTLENVGLKADFPQKLSVALSENPASVLHSLSLAHNALDNQGVSNLIPQLCRLRKGLRSLSLSKTSLSSKGVASLTQALCSSDDYSSSLLHLDLSRNPGMLSGEDATNLYLFLAQPNCLVHLDVSASDCAVDLLFGALLRGCCSDLSYLNLSKNSFSPRKVRETLPTFRQFFSSAFSLSHLSLASMKLPPDMLRALFLGLSSNPHISDLHLDVSSCELRSAGAAVIQDLFPQLSCISTLDISDNGLDSDLLSVIPAFSRHLSLKNLHLGKNFNAKGRVLDEILQKLVQLIQEEECALQSLSLADSRLRSRGAVLVNALGSNVCLRKVDLSGNSLDDAGARMLSKSLQTNTTLRSVTWDRNNTSAVGFQDVARSLEHNFTLQYMPVPLSDVTQAYRSAPGKTEQAMMKIQRALLRNNQSQRFSEKQALRLHQGLLTSSTEQVMDRLCMRVQQQVCCLRASSESKELQAARQVLKEARNSRALYPSLCELAHVLSVDGPVRQKLEALSGEVAKAADKELQVIVDSMVSLCRELCPLSSTTAENLSPGLSSISERVSIPRLAIRTALTERAAQDINQALEEVKLTAVSYLTNSIMDQILQELYATHKTLLHQVSLARQLEDSVTVSRALRHADGLDTTEEDFAICIDTIAIKKRSSRMRRIRPVSTRLSLGDDPPCSPSPSMPHTAPPLSRSASLETLASLPTQGAPLRHVTHFRPRPPRKHRPGHTSVDAHPSENGGVTRLDDGLPDFYTKRVLLDSQISSHGHTQALRRKKKRGMLSILTGLMKNRSTVCDSLEPDARGGACGDECRTCVTTENVYSVIQHSKDLEGVEPPVEGANGMLMEFGMERTPQLSRRPVYGIPLPGMRGFSPPRPLKKQSPDYSEVLSSSEVSLTSEEASRSSDCQAEGQTAPKDGRSQSDGQRLNLPSSETEAEAGPCENQQKPEHKIACKRLLATARHCHPEAGSNKWSEGDEGESAWDRQGNEEEEGKGPQRGRPRQAELETPFILEEIYSSPKKMRDVPNEKRPLHSVPPPAPPSATKPVFRVVDSPVTQGLGDEGEPSSIRDLTNAPASLKSLACEEDKWSEGDEGESAWDRQGNEEEEGKGPQRGRPRQAELETPFILEEIYSSPKKMRDVPNEKRPLHSVPPPVPPSATKPVFRVVDSPVTQGLGDEGEPSSIRDLTNAPASLKSLACEEGHQSSVSSSSDTS
ncbi:capping protein, Arp2/3 and myosin-I linker protein 3 isoform X2 [Electrophorus electricus]|uniref:capping protein, Arp2/3 and myosin-I linker protein 3 isoform X2 n=1 Tax=Electrophorus electricus TaxID=8005 RepID=UPI0015CFE70E|nr:capping protein, Arp2/3 and myosin-I linker protein 3 isoform X2 [Electrophorus electricus]